MSAQKRVVSTIRLLINAGGAKPAPPVGPALGQAGLNIMAFCKDFNAKTANIKEGVPMRALVNVYPDKSYDWQLKQPPAVYFIKKAAGLAYAADRPGHEVVGAISLKHLYEIAVVKQKDTPELSLESIVKSLISTCRSMGVKVVPKPQNATP